MRASDGAIYGTIGFLLDVTEQRETEKQLEQTHNLLQAIFAGMDEAVFVVDPKDRTIITANPAVKRIFGYSTDEVIGSNTTFLHPGREAYEEWNRGGAQALNQHGVFRSEWCMRRKNGELFWAEITVRHIDGPETWNQGVVSVIRDISERKAHMEALNKKSRELGERVKELNCLFAVADLLNDPHSSLENVLQSVVDALPPSFRFPRSTCVRLTLDGKSYTSGDFEETPWCLTSRLQSDQSKGLIEVCYREEKHGEAEGPFLEEERRMLDGVADRLGSYLHRREAIGTLRAIRKRLQHLLTVSPGIIFSASVTPPYKTTFISENVRDLLGYEPNRFIEDPKFWLGQIHPKDRSKIKNALKGVSPDQMVSNEYRFQHRDGSWRWLLDFSRLMTDEDGHPVEYVGSLVDITQRKNAEAELQRLNRTLLMVSRCNEALVRSQNEKELLESILHHLVDSGGYSIATVWFIGQEGECFPPAVYPEKAAEFLSERDEEESDLLERLSRVCLQAFSGEIFTTEELFTQCPECRKLAEIFDVHSVFALPLKLKKDNIGCLTLFNPRNSFSSEEVKLLKELGDDLAYGIRALRTEVAHRLAEKSLRVRNRAMEASSNGIMISEAKFPEMPIIYVNPAFERITGYSAEEVVGLNPRLLSTGDQKQKGLVDIRTALKEGEQAEALVRNYRKDGSLFWNDFSVAPVPNEAGETTHYIGIINDVTELKQYEEELERKANFDELTGLANRNLLADRLQQGIAFADRHEGSFAILLIDLDRFHIINASMGHHMGNELLKWVAKRLESRVRSQDTLARLGADEFVLLLQDIQAPDALNVVVEKVRSALDPPFTLGTRRLSITASIGIAMYPRDGADGDALIRNAGIAKFHAKKSDGDTFRFFSKEMSTRVVETMDLEADLRLALEREEFLLHFQPKVEVATNRIIGCEALVRWRHPERGLVSPGEFIPLAEQTGLIEPLGEWILMEACRRNRSWQDGGCLRSPWPSMFRPASSKMRSSLNRWTESSKRVVWQVSGWISSSQRAC